MDKQKAQSRLEDIISKGSISEIEEFMMYNFHKINHTTSMRLLINRLKRMERIVNGLKIQCSNWDADWMVDGEGILKIMSQLEQEGK